MPIHPAKKSTGRAGALRGKRRGKKIGRHLIPSRKTPREGKHKAERDVCGSSRPTGAQKRKRQGRNFERKPRSIRGGAHRYNDRRLSGAQTCGSISLQRRGERECLKIFEQEIVRVKAKQPHCSSRLQRKGRSESVVAARHAKKEQTQSGRKRCKGDR